MMVDLQVVSPKLTVWLTMNLPKHQWSTRGVDAYEKIECIGAGTYGYPIAYTIYYEETSMADSCCDSQVFMAKNKETQEIVAIKKIRSLNEVQGVR
jgi:cyclin-dependent kinase 12/13